MNIPSILLACTLLPARAADKAPESLYSMEAHANNGKTVSLSRYKGKVALVVNTASRCGFTPQYKGLQALQDKYGKRGLIVLGFPSNDFHSQEPGTDKEIKNFCEINYGVTFPLFAKDHVTGKETQPVFKFLKASPAGGKDGEIGWNFTKFIVDKDGRVAARFPTKTDPSAPQVTAKIEELLR